MLRACGAACAPAWLEPHLPAVLRLLFQNLLVEPEERVLRASMDTWREVLRAASPAMLHAALTPALLHTLLTLASTPQGHALDRSLMLLLAPPEGSLADMPVVAPTTGNKRARGRCGVAAEAPLASW